MSLRVLFFARIRDQLGTGSVEIEFPTQGMSLDTLQQQLVQRGGTAWDEALGADNIIRAINHEVCSGDRELRDGDEVAFYPPVTGG